VSHIRLVVPVAMLAAVGLAVFVSARNTLPPPAPPAESRTSEPPRLFGATPDDPPALTRSGRVLVSRDPERPPALGPALAKVNVIVFSDFLCPVCRRAAGGTRQIAEEWPGQVRLEFRQFAPAIHRNSENTAVASLAAHRQGKFWGMDDVLFANAGRVQERDFPEYARAAGCDVERWAKDYADPALRRRVQEESAEGPRLGGNSTPSFLINGKVMVGWASWLVLRQQVQDELKAVDALLASGVPLAEVHAMRARETAKDAAAFEEYRAVILRAG